MQVIEAKTLSGYGGLRRIERPKPQSAKLDYPRRASRDDCRFSLQSRYVPVIGSFPYSSLFCC
ncbi:MAG: hypothetical protein ABSC06_16905 [Rhodopila sp.]